MAWLGPQPVPFQLVSGHPQTLPGVLADTGRNPAALARLTSGLRRRGLARITPCGIGMHRVPAALLVASTAGERHTDRVDDWAGAAIRLLRAYAPRGLRRSPGRHGGSSCRSCSP